MYAGIDGCRQGWVAFVLGEGEELVEGYRDFATLVADLAAAGVRVFGVDMPIDPPARGERECDLAVRQLLGDKRSSLFVTPTRAALEAQTQSQASQINRRHGGKGVSAQAFALRHKILEVDRARGQHEIIEIHPELAFHLLGDVRHSKRTWAGVRERVAVLEAHGLHPQQWPSSGWGATDDTLDAAVAALSARRYAMGSATAAPDNGTTPIIWA